MVSSRSFLIAAEMHQTFGFPLLLPAAGAEDRGCPQSLPLTARLRLVLAIPSLPDAKPRRDAIRATWCRALPSGDAAVAARFWIGTAGYECDDGLRCIDDIALDARVGGEARVRVRASSARVARVV